MKRLFHFAVVIAMFAGRVLLAGETNTFTLVPVAADLPQAGSILVKSNSVSATNTAPVVVPAVDPQPETRAPAQLVVSPGGGLNGKVVKADGRGRFVVLNFPLGQMPAADSALDVYRNGVKVGEIKVTGPQRDDNMVADVVSGELQAGDVARSR